MSTKWSVQVEKHTGEAKLDVTNSEKLLSHQFVAETLMC